MQKFLSFCFIISALFFVVDSQNDTNVTLPTTTIANAPIAISSKSVKIVVKCRDTNSLLTNINLDNSGSMTMNNNEQIDEKTMDSVVHIMFDSCLQRRPSGLFSLLQSLSSDTDNNEPQVNFSGMSFSKTFRMNLDDELHDKQMMANETTTMP